MLTHLFHSHRNCVPNPRTPRRTAETGCRAFPCRGACPGPRRQLLPKDLFQRALKFVPLLLEIHVSAPMSNAFFEQPILNSPYAYPSRHWELDRDGQPTQKIDGGAAT